MLQACHWGPLDRVFLLALNTAAPVALLVPVLYWPYSNTLTHACVLQSIAVALLLLEVILSRAPFVSYQCQVRSCLYHKQMNLISSL